MFCPKSAWHLEIEIMLTSFNHIAYHKVQTLPWVTLSLESLKFYSKTKV